MGIAAHIAAGNGFPGLDITQDAPDALDRPMDLHGEIAENILCRTLIGKDEVLLSRDQIRITCKMTHKAVPVIENGIKAVVIRPGQILTWRRIKRLCFRFFGLLRLLRLFQMLRQINCRLFCGDQSDHSLFLRGQYVPAKELIHADAEEICQQGQG